MEGAGEINETIENTEDAPHLVRKESDSSRPSDNSNLMVSFASPETDWRENLSLLRSPEHVIEDLKGKDLVRLMNSNSGPESPVISPRIVNDADEMVEELTLNNFKYPIMSRPSSSNVGNEKQMKRGPWENFYKLMGESSNKLPKQPISTEDGQHIQNFSMCHSGTQRFPVQKRTEVSNLNVSEQLPQSKNALVNSPTAFSMGIRTKMLPSSGFSELLVKSTLKGKGVAYRHLESCGVPRVATKTHDVGRMSKDSMKGLPDKLYGHNAKADNIPSLDYGGGSDDFLASDYPYGVSLRHWLKLGKHKVNKVERHQIFKQVVEFVDCSHSKGIALQHLRPSYFMIFPSNHVTYVGTFISQTHEQIGSVSGQATDNSHSSAKRKWYQQSENPGLFPVKYHKVNEDINVSVRPTSLGGVLRRELPKGFDIENSIAGNPVFEYDPREQSMLGERHQSQIDCNGATMLSNMTLEVMHLEERWYASPEELNGSACTFTSNIYSLGVLLFELFSSFESQEAHATAMLDLRQRILPSSFLSESPLEAGFCLWLLHPESSSRPKSREVLSCKLVSEMQNLSPDESSVSFDEKDAQSELLLHFLLTMKEQKERQAEKLVENLGRLQVDIEEVEKRHSSRIGPLSSSMLSFNEILDKNLYKEPSHLASVSRMPTTYMDEERLMKNIDQLENVYFSMRSGIELPETNAAERSDKDVLRNREKYLVTQNDDELNIDQESDHLGDFFDGFCKYAQYNGFEVRGTLRNGDILNSANVICSLSFDRDEEYIAAAGIARKIKIFEYASLLSDTVDIHYPVVEMPSKSKLSCVCWNSYIKNYLASTDYDGTVQLWDASTGQGFSQFTEHQRRAWSVDFSNINPTKFASGSDDCSVKLWSINEKNCTDTIRNVANVCCVQFSAHSSNMLAFGSADYKIYGYDLRNTRIPWCTMVGHGKAVSYVKFVDSETLVSASTDNTLKLWDLNKTSSIGLSTNACTLTFSGHTNEKNFVGLSVSNGYISCGSETNEVYAYYKSLPMPITSHKFGSIDPISGEEIGDDNGQFVSSVCWRRKSDMVVAANSSGCIKLLQLV